MRFSSRRVLALLLGSAVLATFGPATRAAAAAPPNDEIWNATVITAIPSRFAQDNSQATYNAGTDSAGYPCIGGNSIWYRYRPASTVTARVSTQGSVDGVLLGVFKGTAGHLTTVACSDYTDVGPAVQVQLTAATTYFIAVSTCCDAGVTYGGLRVLSLYLPRSLSITAPLTSQSAGDVSGRAFFNGTVRCSNPGSYCIRITVSERVGSLVARGTGSLNAVCSRAKRPWSLAVDSETGVAFRPGPASISVDRMADDGFGIVDRFTTQIVTLALTPNKRRT